jgi:beta-lactamase superfamily II metal-dependent hydrolase
MSRAVRALRSGLSLLLLAVVAAAGFWIQPSRSEATGLLRVTFVDVGQGDAAWLSTPDGWDILIDGGPQGAGAELVSFLEDQGVADIEVLILSHPHADHVGGLVAVLENLDVDLVLTNCQAYPTAIYQTFVNLLYSEAIPSICVREGDTFTWGSYVAAAAVNPPDPLMSGTGSDVNNNSIVLRISYGSVDFLFTGDIESDAEAAILLSGSTLEAEILKVAHHGSDSSSTDAFLTQVDPDEAVISVGASNAYGHPASQTEHRVRSAGCTVYRTDLHGTIVVTTDGTSYWVQPDRSVYIFLSLSLHDF